MVLCTSRHFHKHLRVDLALALAESLPPQAPGTEAAFYEVALL